MKTLPTAQLPDPFHFDDGSPVKTPDDWRRRREQIRQAVIEIEYGGMPATPAQTTLQTLHSTGSRERPDGQFISSRVVTHENPHFSFMLYLTVPPREGPRPVVLSGDGCWRYATDQVKQRIIDRGYVLAQFNRVEIAPDIYRPDRDQGLYRVERDGDYGALSAWAWGYHRCVDVLADLPFVDAEKIAVVGHSRGGKASLLAGATDERIAITSANNSGAGGAGCYRVQGPKSETLADLMRAISYWFGPQLREYVGRESELPFDQHFLKARVASRALLTTEALADLWANPSGTYQTHLAAKEVYRLLGEPERAAIRYREGGHNHGEADWQSLLDFMAWQFDGDRPEWLSDDEPFASEPVAFEWRAPTAVE